MVTTDFENWIDNNVENVEDAYNLEQCILSKDTMGAYNYAENKGQIFITAFDAPLRIATDKAKETFLSMLKCRYAAEGTSLEAVYESYRQMSNPNC